MTREAFIRKWLANKNFQYCEEGRAEMREDLDKVIEYHNNEQKLPIHSVSGKRPDFKSILARHTQTAPRSVGKGCNYETYIIERDFQALLTELSEAACASGAGEKGVSAAKIKPCSGCSTDCYNWQIGDCKKSS